MDGLNLTTDKMLASIENGVGVMTYNQPEKRNAVNHEMRLAVIDILNSFAENPDVRVVVITGAGGKAFVSGADISEFDSRRSTPEQIAEYGAVSKRVGQAYAMLGKPLIGMIRGFCLGGGLATALNADIRIATDGSQFGIPAARLGLGFGFEGVKNLAAVVGQPNAAEILYTGRRFTADEALAMGLVNRVVPDDELESAVRELAEQIAENAPLTLRSLNFSLRENAKEPADRDAARIQELVDACMASEDYKEGRKAFMEKRKAVFKGR
ncbi:MAG: enoyl-CoA hydratase [Pseudomonadota bacterium]|nr:enoyl-CoA hydratase [Pseudomonadota bacterium]